MRNNNSLSPASCFPPAIFRTGILRTPLCMYTYCIYTVCVCKCMCHYVPLCVRVCVHMCGGWAKWSRGAFPCLGRRRECVCQPCSCLLRVFFLIAVAIPQLLGVCCLCLCICVFAQASTSVSGRLWPRPLCCSALL